jgi:hypothetical protein
MERLVSKIWHANFVLFVWAFEKFPLFRPFVFPAFPNAFLVSRYPRAQTPSRKDA